METTQKRGEEPGYYTVPASLRRLFEQEQKNWQGLRSMFKRHRPSDARADAASESQPKRRKTDSRKRCRDVIVVTEALIEVDELMRRADVLHSQTQQWRLLAYAKNKGLDGEAAELAPFGKEAALGALSAVLVQAKYIMQRAWVCGNLLKKHPAVVAFFSVLVLCEARPAQAPFLLGRFLSSVFPSLADVSLPACLYILLCVFTPLRIARVKGQSKLCCFHVEIPLFFRRDEDRDVRTDKCTFTRIMNSLYADFSHACCVYTFFQTVACLNPHCIDPTYSLPLLKCQPTPDSEFKKDKCKPTKGHTMSLMRRWLTCLEGKLTQEALACIETMGNSTVLIQCIHNEYDVLDALPQTPAPFDPAQHPFDPPSPPASSPAPLDPAQHPSSPPSPPASSPAPLDPAQHPSSPPSPPASSPAPPDLAQPAGLSLSSPAASDIHEVENRVVPPPPSPHQHELCSDSGSDINNTAFPSLEDFDLDDLDFDLDKPPLSQRDADVIHNDEETNLSPEVLSATLSTMLDGQHDEFDDLSAALYDDDMQYVLGETGFSRRGLSDFTSDDMQYVLDESYYSSAGLFSITSSDRLIEAVRQVDRRFKAVTSDEVFMMDFDECGAGVDNAGIDTFKMEFEARHGLPEVQITHK